jgi:hypothetical protein
VEENELVAHCDRLGRLKYSSALPYAFTEQGVAMLSIVLRGSRAIRVNLQNRIATNSRLALSLFCDIMQTGSEKGAVGE